MIYEGSLLFWVFTGSVLVANKIPWLNQKKAIKIKKHGRLSMSLFRYGLDYVQMAIQRLIGFGKKEEFKEILAILRRQNPDRIRVL